MRGTNAIPLGCSLLSPVGTVNSIETLKAGEQISLNYGARGNEELL
jgi:hypothetical protein